MIATLFGGIGGLALSITGGGGAILILPLFVFLFHVSVHKALLLSLATISFSALVGMLSYRKWTTLEHKVAAMVIFGGVLAVPLGTYVSYHISEHYLLLFFSIIMASVGCFLWLKEQVLAFINRRVPTTYYDKKPALSHWIVLFSLGLLSGFLCGFLGIGAGLLLVPVLALSLAMPVSKAGQLSLLIVMVISLAGMVCHLSYRVIDTYWLMSFVFGGILGLMIGGRLSRLFPERLVQRIAAILILSLALAMFFLA